MINVMVKNIIFRAVQIIYSSYNRTYDIIVKNTLLLRAVQIIYSSYNRTYDIIVKNTLL